CRSGWACEWSDIENHPTAPIAETGPGARMNRLSPEAAVSLDMHTDLAEPGLLSDLVTITKARLSLLVIVTTFVGVCMASGVHLDWLLIINATLGTALAAAASGVLNQVMEA